MGSIISQVAIVYDKTFVIIFIRQRRIFCTFHYIFWVFSQIILFKNLFIVKINTIKNKRIGNSSQFNWILWVIGQCLGKYFNKKDDKDKTVIQGQRKLLNYIRQRVWFLGCMLNYVKRKDKMDVEKVLRKYFTVKPENIRWMQAFCIFLLQDFVKCNYCLTQSQGPGLQRIFRETFTNRQILLFESFPIY